MFFCNVLIICISSYIEFGKVKFGFHNCYRLVESLAPKGSKSSSDGDKPDTNGQYKLPIKCSPYIL
jgi:hypothetical protein